MLWTLIKLLSRNEQSVVFLKSGWLNKTVSFHNWPTVSKPVIQMTTFQHCTLLVCSSGNAQLGCFSVPTRTDAEVSLFVRCKVYEQKFAIYQTWAVKLFKLQLTQKCSNLINLTNSSINLN